MDVPSKNTMNVIKQHQKTNISKTPWKLERKNSDSQFFFGKRENKFVSIISSRCLDSPTTPNGWLSYNYANRRQQALANLQSMCRTVLGHEKFSVRTFCQLFSKIEIHILLFQLFDDKSQGKITQSHILDVFNEKLGKEGRKFVDMFDTTAYVIAGEADLDSQLFSRIFQTEKLLVKLFKVVDVDRTGEISLERVIVFIMDLSMTGKHRNLNRVKLESIDELFCATAREGRSELTLDDFKKLIPSKDPFFAERVFRILDKDNSNTISTSELRQGLEQLSSKSVEDKVHFLFRIYDRDGDGLIQLHEVKAVLKACTEENKMVFSDEQLDQLALALYEDAADSIEDGVYRADNGLEYEHLKAQLDKHPGLVDELSFSLERFLIPSSTRRMRKPRSPSTVFWPYFRNNAAFMFFIFAYLFVNLALLVSRAMQYRDQMPVYMFARAFGQVLNFNCAFVVVLMLRYCITWLRQTKLAVVLPLDHHVYLHKLCGFAILLFGGLHTLMHLINFPLNVANEVISSVTNQTHTAEEWLFTMIPGMYGLIPGIANLTGWGLLAILLVLISCSLPFVRKTGYFELFYWTHLLHFPFWVLLILHGPNFWMWFVGPATLYILLEKGLRLKARQIGNGNTFINQAILLPSQVTHLVCRKPPNFNFHPGDYVYVNIPTIASSEWHPFTISSPPELPDVFWLHIRGVGGWTNRLYEYFKGEQTAKHDTLVPSISVNIPSNNPSRISRQGSRNENSTHEADDVEQQPTSYETHKGTRIIYSPQVSVTSFSESLSDAQNVTHGYRYMRRPPDVINLPVPENPQNFEKINLTRKKSAKTPRDLIAPETVRRRKKYLNPINEDEIEEQSNTETCNEQMNQQVLVMEEGINMYHPLKITIDGPYGTPSSHIFQAQHAVLIAAGIGVTPFASILQSIMHRYYASLQICPRCQHSWASKMPDSIMNLKKVDFFWINRNQRSFEWFVNMLSQLEMEQAELDSVLDRFLDLHMYITSALKKTDMKAIGLQMALDLLHAKEKRDLVTGLKTRTIAGRPNWDKVFQKLVDEEKGSITVFYCGPPQLAKELRKKCNQFGFEFRKEIF